MNQNPAQSLVLRIALAGSLIAPLVLTTPAASQVSARTQRSSAIEQPESRAEHEAESMVSLSPDKIIGLLRQETGLLLEVKKAIVRKAFEQGRILDPADLTDEALYRLVEQDENIRIIATREIVNRSYIRAKPTREELERRRENELPVRAKAESSAAAKSESPLLPNATVTQEQIYWLKHEDDLSEPSRRTPPPAPSEQNRDAEPMYTQPPVAPAPQQNVPTDSRRQVERTDLQPPDFGGSDFSSPAQASRIQPDELPTLFDGASARYASASARQPLGSPTLPNSLPLGSSSQGLPADMQSQSQNLPSQRASIGRTQQLPRMPAYQPSGNPVLRHSPNPYADVPSLYDLYSQYSGKAAVLHRFGEDIFQNGTGNFDELPMDMPAGPEYVVGPGDGLSIELWGGVSQRLQRTVDREGRVALPEAGLVQVSGRSLGEVQRLVQNVLRGQFRDVEADVSLARLRTVRVYVVGDVQRPGAYDISSLSTPLNAVYSAGGPTARGSLRILQHYRGKQLIQQVDVYGLLLHGVQTDLQHLEAGDTIMVPPLGPEVTIEGMVRRPAVYELNGEKNLAEALELAGGVMTSGTLRHVDVERVEAHLSRSMLRLDIPENNNEAAITKALEDFTIQDGDKVKISPILPYADKTVYLDGHVFRPGKFAYRDGMKVSDLIKSYNDLLPEPYKQHAEIIRLSGPDHTPTVIAFNLGEALEGKDQDVALKPFDTVRVFGRFDFEDQPVVSVSGEVRDPGDHVTNGATYLRDAIYLAGGVTSDALLDDAQVFRRTSDGKIQVFSLNLSKALSGDETNNLLLEPRDRVIVHKNLAKLDPPSVVIQGEIAKPGKYPLGAGMSAAELVRVAGGFKRSAYTETADLTRYAIEDGKKVTAEHTSVPIALAMSGQPDTDVRLHDGDVLTIGQLSGWKDIGAQVTVRGEVVHPGTYGIQPGERLSSVIQRAGGFRPDAFPYGAVYQRVTVRDLEEKNRAVLIREVQDQEPSLALTPDGDPEQKVAKVAALQQWQQTLEQLQNTPPSGRLVIHISNDTRKWQNTLADIPVRAGDAVYIPKGPNIVMITGSVYNPTAITFKPGKSAGWYLQQAGGPTAMANKKAIFVIRANGSVVAGNGGMFSGGVEKAGIQPGDTVVVPEKAFSANSRWKTLLQASQLAYTAGVAAQVAISLTH